MYRNFVNCPEIPRWADGSFVVARVFRRGESRLKRHTNRPNPASKEAGYSNLVSTADGRLAELSIACVVKLSRGGSIDKAKGISKNKF
jgi:hypothetical protein